MVADVLDLVDRRRGEDAPGPEPTEGPEPGGLAERDRLLAAASVEDRAAWDRLLWRLDPMALSVEPMTVEEHADAHALADRIGVSVTCGGCPTCLPPTLDAGVVAGRLADAARPPPRQAGHGCPRAAAAGMFDRARRSRPGAPLGVLLAEASRLAGRMPAPAGCGPAWSGWWTGLVSGELLTAAGVAVVDGSVSVGGVRLVPADRSSGVWAVAGG